MANTKKKAEKKTTLKKVKKVEVPKTRRVWNGESYDIINL